MIRNLFPPARAICFLILTTSTVAGIATCHAAPSSSARTPSPTASVVAPTALPLQCDQDKDGSRRKDIAECGGTDCNDQNGRVHPLAMEGDTATCQDGLDNDCNGKADCADTRCEGLRVATPNSVKLTNSGMCCGFTAKGENGRAVDISKDPNNCGACNVRCSPDQSCVDGACLGSCDLARTRCFTDRESVSLLEGQPQGSRFENFPAPVQGMLEAYLGDPSCPRPRREPTYVISTFSEAITDHRGKPTGDTLRGVCVSIRF